MQLSLAFAALVLLLPILGSAQTARTPQSPSKTAAPVDQNQAILQHADAATGEIAAQQELANAKRISAEADYQAWSLKHAEEAYEWQHVSTIIIFFVVILLMVAGVVFSWIQFRQGMHYHPVQAIASTVSTIAQPAASAPDSAQADSEVIEKSSVTEFSASPQGIKVASSTLGVIILVISMCFFYMYLSYVYPISIHNANQAVSAAKTVTEK
jgi:uncharacterized membrane protein